MIGEIFKHPLSRGIDIDAPAIVPLRRKIIKSKPFLNKLYADWYRTIAAEVPDCDGAVLEIGSGAGFLSEFVPGLITSEVFFVPGMDLALNAFQLPFKSNSLRAILMTDVFHHLPGPREFLAEAARCMRPGGRIVMIEPWYTPWSGLIYGRLHHEPFHPGAREWEFPSSGPLSGANGALPWMVFQRDAKQFLHEFPQWNIVKIEPDYPFVYLLSGGMAYRSLIPGFLFNVLRGFEKLMKRFLGNWAMFAQIIIERTREPI